MANARCMRAAQFQARGAGFTPTLAQIAGQRRRRGRRLGHAPSIDDHSPARAGARGQHAMVNNQVCFGPRRHRRQAFCAVGRLGRQRPSPADYVTVAGARGGEIAAGGSPPQGARVAYAPARSFAARLRPFRNARRWSRRRRHLRRSGPRWRGTLESCRPPDQLVTGAA